MKNKIDAKPPFAGAQCSADTSELSAIINATRQRGCNREIKWLIELRMTNEEMKRFNELTGWTSRDQPVTPEFKQSAMAGMVEK